MEVFADILAALMSVEHPWAIWLAGAVVALTSLIGTAAVLVEALEKLAALTPTTKDDALVAKLKVWVEKVHAFLAAVALRRDKLNK